MCPEVKGCREIMRMVLQISCETGCLCVTATGKFSLAEAKRTFLAVVKTVEEHRVGKVLFDGRGLKGKPETIERFYYGAFAAREVGQYAVRNRCPSPEFAYVLHVPVLDPYRLGEMVAVNRGMRVKVFGDLEGARAWLGRRAGRGH
jgi:hypothetical protein